MYAHWVAPFLEQLKASGNVSQSARLVGISSSQAYDLKRKDGDFAAGWEVALEDAADDLEAEARRRAVKGVQEPVVYQGQLTPVWARDQFGELIEEEYTARMLIDGEWKNVTQKRPVQARDVDGQPVWLTVTKYSDPLLALLLKGRRKQVFADRTELTGADGAPVQVQDSTARAARVAHLMALAAKRKQSSDDFGDIA